jgi:formate dehydrogenase subunit beta
MTFSFLMKYQGKTVGVALQDFFGELLNCGCVKAILLPMEMEGGLVAPGLLTDPARKEASQALSPYMPLNTARLLQQMTRMVPPSERVAAVMRPCEARALVELVKLRQIQLDNLIVISIDCPGTYPLAEYKKMIEAGKDPMALLVEQLNQGNQDERLRDACKTCLYPCAPSADIRIGFFGLDKGEFLIEALTQAGEQALRELGQEAQDIHLGRREQFLKQLHAKRKAGEHKILEEQRQNLRGPDKLLSALSSCVSCRNCMTMCPICYCKECFFHSPTFEMEADRYVRLAKRKGAARMPADILLFHITRMAHMATSCVQCGMCEEACPMEVPVFRLFKAASAQVQALLTYEPGRSFDEEIPIAAFREEELEGVQEPKI